ncbi:hypothetical protein [Dankookia sp. P2]|uniref:hypothetical protein n=1 Tax=Dankookia sp. P2 TaxID=3423955 RepID=UPI003D6790BC
MAPGDLLAAWSLARRAAALELWGPPRLLRFDRPDGEATEIAIADADAGCWAEAIDEGYGLQTLPGLALCLRLLALVEILARVPALAPLFDVTPEGIELHPALLDAAATLPLDAGARFDEAAISASIVAPTPARCRRPAPHRMRRAP